MPVRGSPLRLIRTYPDLWTPARTPMDSADLKRSNLPQAVGPFESHGNRTATALFSDDDAGFAN